VGKYCYVASARRRARRLGATGKDGRGILWRPPAQLVYLIQSGNHILIDLSNDGTIVT